MLRFFFLTVLFSLMLFACGKHDLIDDGYADDEDKLQSSSSTISSSGTSSFSSSSLFSSSSGGEPPVSSSGESSSGSHEELSSSSSDAATDVCDFSERSYINAECSYDETVSLTKDLLLGSQAKLHFADKASLSMRGYLLKISKGAKLYFGESSELLIESWGSLEVSGEEENPVVFAAANAGKPWKGIRIVSNAQSIKIEHADLSGAIAGIEFGKDAELKNSKIHDNEYGIKQNSPFSAGNFSGNEFYLNVYNAGVSLAVAATLGSPKQFAGRLHISGNQDIGGIILPGFVYFVDRGVITVKGELEIEAGAHFYFTESSSVAVTTGSIKAVGIADSLIIFEPENPAFFWGNSTYNFDNREAAFYFDGGCGGKSVFGYFKVLRAKTAFVSACPEPVELSNGSVMDYRDKDFLNTGGVMGGGFSIDDGSVTSTPYAP
jgi:hypothetical protein